MTDVDLTRLSAGVGGSSPLHGYLATPDGQGPWPGLVMIHEVFGLDDVLRRHADRFAQAGYLTLAVDLFSSGGTLRCMVSTMRAMFKGKGQAFADIDAAHQWLAESDECTGKIGVIGFCMGGGFALLTANTGFTVSSVNYGQLPSDLEEALVGACPMIGTYGGRDRTLKGAAQKLDDALTALGIEHDVKEYPTAGHTFLNDAEVGPKQLRPLFRVMGIRPDPQASDEAWKRIDSYLAIHLH